MTADSQTALDITARLVACGVLLSALELFSGRRHFRREGVFGLGAVAPFRRSIRLLGAADRAIPVLLGLQAAGAAVLAAAGPIQPAGRLALVPTIAAMLTVRWRRHAGGDGAEQLAALVLVATALAVLPAPAGPRVVAAVLFVAAQVTLSYVTAGIAKLGSRAWRDGSALPGVLSTEGHGHPWASAFLMRYPGLARIGSGSVIVFECAFPFLVLGPTWLALATLAAGVAFHAACAVLMGLNSFVWSFVAAYPCVLAGAIQVKSWLVAVGWR